MTDRKRIVQGVGATEVAEFAAIFDAMSTNIGKAVLEKQHVVHLALTCLISQGHLLLEDVPGTGKTMLARAVANTVSASHSRIQFTPDLLPSDVTGVTVYDQQRGTFDFHRGPVFHSIVLADEINRASPKTQAALLEVMEEGQVTVDGTTHAVEQPFMVIATQNPVEQAGTYRLPEAQLDRFLMRTALGHPAAAALEELLLESAVRDRSAALRPVASGDDILRMASLANAVRVDPAVARYVRLLTDATRSHPHVRLGLSARGALALMRVAKTWALANGRDHVLPQDVHDLAGPVVAHRLVLDPHGQLGGVTVDDVVRESLQAVSAPLVGAGGP